MEAFDAGLIWGLIGNDGGVFLTSQDGIGTGQVVRDGFAT